MSSLTYLAAHRLNVEITRWTFSVKKNSCRKVINAGCSAEMPNNRLTTFKLDKTFVRVTIHKLIIKGRVPAALPTIGRAVICNGKSAV